MDSSHTVDIAIYGAITSTVVSITIYGTVKGRIVGLQFQQI